MTDKEKIPLLLRSGNFLESMQDKDYQISDENVKYHNAFFAFIDILGFKNLLLEKKNDAPLFIFKIIKNAYLFHKSSYESVKLKILSDSILVWSDSDHQINFWNLINVVELLRESFLAHGLLIRGGVSHGKNFIHNDIIVSPALAEAYQLEQKAKFPRVLISDSAKNIGLSGLVQNGPRWGIIYENHYRACEPRMISKDDDNENILTPFLNRHGVICLIDNFPSTYFPGDAIPTEDQINAMKEAGIVELEQARQKILLNPPSQNANKSILEKYNYIYSRFNNLIRTIKVDDKIPLIPLYKIKKS